MLATSVSSFTRLTEADVAHFGSILRPEQMGLEEEVRADYAHDWTEDLHFMPAIVLKPESTGEVSA
ncbi:MAG: hypothetical protein ACK5XP_03415, partial [Sphingobacteriia bacterium]